MVYRKQKHSTSPGPRAKEVVAARSGDSYAYVVEKFWIVQQVLEDNQVQLVTRTGKQHTVSLDDPNLRRAHWWERWMHQGRFRDAEKVADV